MSTVSVETRAAGWTIWVRIRAGTTDFLISKTSNRPWDQSTLLLDVYRGSFTEVKRPS